MTFRAAGRWDGMHLVQDTSARPLEVDDVVEMLHELVAVMRPAF